MKYEQAVDGEWIWPKRKGHKVKCCDCGLVHQLDYRAKDGHIQFRAFRDNRATGQVRRHMRDA